MMANDVEVRSGFYFEAGAGAAVCCASCFIVRKYSSAALRDWLGHLGEEHLVIFDPGPLAASLPGDVLAPVLARADWVTCNARESALLTGAADPGDALRALTGRFPRAGVLVRIGPDGCLLGGPGFVAEQVPGFRVEVVDTNGAGDTHTGAFLAALSAGASWLEAVRRANGAAALSVTGRGPATGPSLAELDAFLA